MVVFRKSIRPQIFQCTIVSSRYRYQRDKTWNLSLKIKLNLFAAHQSQIFHFINYIQE